MAVECDGDQFHGLEEWDRDVDRQRMLERCGLQFWRVRGSAYYRDPIGALQPLWKVLSDSGICAESASSSTAAPPAAAPSPATEASAMDEEEADNGEPPNASSEPDDSTDVEIGAEPTEEEQVTLFPAPQFDLSVALAPYSQWLPRSVPDPHSASLTELTEKLVEIIAVEGPVICRRVYFLYNRAAGNSRLGKQIVHVMNRAIYRAFKLGRLAQNDEQKRGGQINQVVRIAGTPEVNLRERGPRSLEEIPPLEIAAVRDQLVREDPALEEDQLLRQLAAVYRVGRVTTQIRKTLLG